MTASHALPSHPIAYTFGFYTHHSDFELRSELINKLDSEVYQQDRNTTLLKTGNSSLLRHLNLSVFNEYNIVVFICNIVDKTSYDHFVANFEKIKMVPELMNKVILVGDKAHMVSEEKSFEAQARFLIDNEIDFLTINSKTGLGIEKLRSECIRKAAIQDNKHAPAAIAPVPHERAPAVAAPAVAEAPKTESKSELKSDPEPSVMVLSFEQLQAIKNLKLFESEDGIDGIDGMDILVAQFQKYNALLSIELANINCDSADELRQLKRLQIQAVQYFHFIISKLKVKLQNGDSISFLRKESLDALKGLTGSLALRFPNMFPNLLDMITEELNILSANTSYKLTPECLVRYEKDKCDARNVLKERNLKKCEEIQGKLSACNHETPLDAYIKELSRCNKQFATLLSSLDFDDPKEVQQLPLIQTLALIKLNNLLGKMEENVRELSEADETVLKKLSQSLICHHPILDHALIEKINNHFESIATKRLELIRRPVRAAGSGVTVDTEQLAAERREQELQRKALFASDSTSSSSEASSSRAAVGLFTTPAAPPAPAMAVEASASAPRDLAKPFILNEKESVCNARLF